MDLLSGIKDQALGAFTTNGFSQQQAEEALPMAATGVQEGIMSAVQGGNVAGVSSLLTGALSGGGSSGITSNPIFQSILGAVAGKITSKLGLGSGVVNTALGAVLPLLMSKMGGAAQANGDTNGIGLDDIMAVAGGGGGGVMGAAKNMLGGMLGGK